MKIHQATIIFMISFISLAQDGKFNLGARNSGLAGASITLADHFSLFNNVGGIAKVPNHATFVSYQNRYAIAEFQTLGGGLIYRSPIGNAGIGYYKFGDDLFSQQRIHVAIGHQIQLISLGLGIDLLQYHISSVGTRHVVALQFGGIAEITPQFLLGAHIFNLNQTSLIEEADEQLPTIMKTGISYRPSDELMVNLEVEKELDFDEIIKGGIEYQVVENIVLRTGIATNPRISAFGIGFHPKQFKLDYALVNNSEIGGVHEISVSYQLEE